MILLWIISIIIWVSYAYLITRFNKGVDYHFAEAVFTSIVAILLPFSLLFSETDILNYIQGALFAVKLLGLSWLSIGLICLLLIKILSIPFIILSIKWNVFDSARNKFMGEDWFYYGEKTNSKTKGYLDKKLGKYQIYYKIICLILSILMSIYY